MLCEIERRNLHKTHSHFLRLLKIMERQMGILLFWEALKVIRILENSLVENTDRPANDVIIC